METTLMKTANLGIGIYSLAKEAVLDLMDNTGKGFDSIVEKGSTVDSDLAVNTRKLAEDVSNGVADLQSKVDNFVVEVKTRLEK